MRARVSIAFPPFFLLELFELFVQPAGTAAAEAEVSGRRNAWRLTRLCVATVTLAQLFLHLAGHVSEAVLALAHRAIATLVQGVLVALVCAMDATVRRERLAQRTNGARISGGFTRRQLRRVRDTISA